MSKADVNKLAYVGSLNTKRDSDSWYTPKQYIEAVRQTLGTIGLDPFSSELANSQIQAQEIFTETKSAFDHDWLAPNKTVWMNPPYGRGVLDRAVTAFLKNYDERHFDRAVVLVNNATDTKWFKRLITSAVSVCFTDHRIAFISPDGKQVSGNTRGQVFMLFESDNRFSTQSKFKRAFRPFGSIMRIE